MSLAFQSSSTVSYLSFAKLTIWPNLEPTWGQLILIDQMNSNESFASQSIWCHEFKQALALVRMPPPTVFLPAIFARIFVQQHSCRRSCAETHIGKLWETDRSKSEHFLLWCRQKSANLDGLIVWIGNHPQVQRTLYSEFLCIHVRNCQRVKWSKWCWLNLAMILQTTWDLIYVDFQPTGFKKNSAFYWNPIGPLSAVAVPPTSGWASAFASRCSMNGASILIVKRRHV